MVETAKQLAAKGVKVISVLGFANKDAVILEDELSAYSEVYATTDDGSYGIKGYVSTVVDNWLKSSLSMRFILVERQACSNMLTRNLKITHTPFVNGISNGLRYGSLLRLCGSFEILKQLTSVCEDGPVFETGKIIL